MTAANRGGLNRRKNDAYQTDPDLCVAAMRWARSQGYAPRCGTFLEPSAGQGNFVAAARMVCPDADIHAVDIEADAKALTERGLNWVERADFLTWQAPRKYDFIFGNPPYGEQVEYQKKVRKGVFETKTKTVHVADKHVLRALSMLEDGGHLMFVLRVGFLEAVESEAREELFANHTILDMSVLRPRPSFTGSENDSAPYGLFVWRKDYDGPTLGGVFKWREPKRAARRGSALKSAEPSASEVSARL